MQCAPCHFHYAKLQQVVEDFVTFYAVPLAMPAVNPTCAFSDPRLRGGQVHMHVGV